jgi:hypothetical protein
MLSVSLIPGPTSPEEALREAPSGRASHAWASFSFDVDAGEIGRSDRYRLEMVNLIRGPHPTWVRSGQTVHRTEATGARPPVASPRSLIGTVEPMASSSPEAQADLARRWMDSRWRVALLIPFTLTAEWWRLPREERPPAHLCWTQGTAGGPASEIAARALRILYRARSLPDAEWDFLAYLEMLPQDVAPIRAALAELRDRRRNPTFCHLDRMVELWMTKDLSVHPARRI